MAVELWGCFVKVAGSSCTLYIAGRVTVLLVLVSEWSIQLLEAA